MRRLLNKAIVLAFMALTWVGCSQDEVMMDFELTTIQESESNIQINLNLNIPDPILVGSRGVGTDAIESGNVLCFDGEGKALASVQATFTKIVDENGIEKDVLIATIPNATRILHVFANQESIPFEKGMSEYVTDMVNLPATDDKMVYWARIEVPSDVTTAAEAKAWWAGAKTISLLRNQAKVEVVNNNPSEFTLLGYTVVNTNKQGMVIPAFLENNKYLYPTSNTTSEEGFNLDEWCKSEYIHFLDGNQIESEEALENMLTPEDEGGLYVYETLASSENPASIIIYGYNSVESNNIKYWRVEFADANGTLYNVRRNHRYTVNIEGYILGGFESLQLALDNEPVAIKPEIADEVIAVKNSKFSMTVDNTNYVVKDGKESLEFNFYIKQLGKESFDNDKLYVTWEDGQNVSADDKIVYTSSISSGVFTATVNVSLKRLAAGADNQEGTIIINYNDRLQRKVKIEVIPAQKFTIVSYNGIVNRVLENSKLKFDLKEWDYTQGSYFLEVDETKPPVPIDRLKFSIPETFPQSLYPFNVLVSTSDLNVWDSPLIFLGDNRYGAENGIGYKYVYTVRSKQDVYEMILRSIDRNLIADQVYLTLESEYFEPVDLQIVYPD